MVEAGKTQVPVGGGEGVWAPEHLLHHEELHTVEDYSGDVTEEEDHYNADEDSSQICLATSIFVGLHMGESKICEINLN